MSAKAKPGGSPTDDSNPTSAYEGRPEPASAVHPDTLTPPATGVGARDGAVPDDERAVEGGGAESERD